MSFTVRRMTESDIKTVSELEKICFSQPWSEKAFLEDVNDEKYIFLVAEDCGSIMGYIGCYAVLDEADITNVAVFPDYRRRGVAALLLCELENLLRAETVFLEVRESNLSAQLLYEKCGYKKYGERKNFYSSPAENAILMKKDIISE